MAISTPTLPLTALTIPASSTAAHGSFPVRPGSCAFSTATACRLGVCSNKPVDFTRDLVAYLDLAPLLDVVLGPEDVPRPKPAPDMLQEGLRRLGVGAAEALYVGDMSVDVQTARGAGVAVWVVATGSEERDALERARPDRLFASLEEMAAVLEASPA